MNSNDFRNVACDVPGYKVVSPCHAVASIHREKKIAAEGTASVTGARVVEKESKCSVTVMFRSHYCDTCGTEQQRSLVSVGMFISLKRTLELFAAKQVLCVSLTGELFSFFPLYFNFFISIHRAATKSNHLRRTSLFGVF